MYSGRISCGTRTNRLGGIRSNYSPRRLNVDLYEFLLHTGDLYSSLIIRAQVLDGEILCEEGSMDTLFSHSSQILFCVW